MTPRRCASTHIHVHMQKPRLPWQTEVFNFDSCQRFLDKGGFKSKCNIESMH